MRILLGLLLLLTLFLLAGATHGRWTDEIRNERQELLAARRSTPAAGFETWGRALLTVGRPSEAAPLELPETAQKVSEPPATLGSELELWSEEGSPPPDWTPPIYEMTVQQGQVLSVICEDFYGTGRGPIPDQVAIYNGLRDANSVRAGQTLRLPPLATLRNSTP